MMLSASPFYNPNLYTPTRSSPLSERSANAVPRTFSFNMATKPQSEKKPIPQRAYKPNPVIQSRTGDAGRERRRELFFRKVQKGREEKKWEVRGDQIQRLDFISSQKRWEAEKSRQAPQLDSDCIDEEFFGETTRDAAESDAMQLQQEVTEADYILQQEEREMQALIALMEDEEQSAQDTSSQHYGSDDEDFDQLFVEYTTTAETQNQDQPPYGLYIQSGYADPDAMDMTDG
ncbi:hypothetical protein BCR34DRAFT_626032 [Clohesyomyces aquaticus]|uniref:Uncharacterized protein n=1 Tax=Clohesyomyces aquaticus TaxID=1231657 RepID=A0A1Y1ZFG0_9PLEO|nr:hypothetical protein BCR34DRAFT_626032 [Clohesyomyces aquaticus]